MANQTDVKICPLCEHHNAPDAAVCEVCHAPLFLTGITTLYLDGQPVVPPVIEHPPLNAGSMLAALPEGAVALLVLGQNTPIVVRDHPEITLGRHVQGETSPVVDLADYHAHLLGVSRRHAVIRQDREGYVIEDLNSNNGTWVNEERVLPGQSYPLAHGDQLRLGQLALQVYFS